MKNSNAECNFFRFFCRIYEVREINNSSKAIQHENREKRYRRKRNYNDIISTKHDTKFELLKVNKQIPLYQNFRVCQNLKNL